MKQHLENFWVFTSGKSPTLAKQCSAQTIANVQLQGRVIFLTALISGGIFALTISAIALHNITWALILWPVCFWLISTLDKSIVSHKGRMDIRTFRIALAVSMGILLTNFVHLIIYQPEIDAEIEAMLKEGVQEIEQRYDQLKNPIFQQIETLDADKQVLVRDIKAAWDFAEEEAVAKNAGQEFGEGEKYKGKKLSAQRIEQRARTQMSAIDSMIRHLEAELEPIIKEEELEKKKLEETKIGISHRSQAFSALFSRSSWWDKFLIVLFSLFFFAIDMAPLVISRSFPVDEFYEISALNEKTSKEKVVLEMEAQLQLERERIAFDTSIASIKIKFDALHRQRLLSQQESLDELKVRQEWFDSILEQEGKWEKAYPQYFEAYLKPSIEKALNDYKLAF
jgi:hypothetical protein